MSAWTPERSRSPQGPASYQLLGPAQLQPRVILHAPSLTKFTVHFPTLSLLPSRPTLQSPVK